MGRALPPSTSEHPGPLPSFEDLNFGLRLPRQQMMEHKKLDRFLETEKRKKEHVSLLSIISLVDIKMDRELDGTNQYCF